MMKFNKLSLFLGESLNIPVYSRDDRQLHFIHLDSLLFCSLRSHLRPQARRLEFQNILLVLDLDESFRKL